MLRVVIVPWWTLISGMLAVVLIVMDNKLDEHSVIVQDSDIHLWTPHELGGRRGEYAVHDARSEEPFM